MRAVNEASLVTHRCEGDGSDYDFERIIPTYYVLDQTQEFVCKEDNRVKVIDTTLMPFKAICKLYMKAANGDNLIGSGWLTHDNKLYTAGHCVYHSGYGGWMKSITVVPGQSGLSQPYGEYTATHMVTTQSWRNEGSKRYDIGAIKLGSSVSHSDFLVPDLADTDRVTVCGYPSDRDKGIFQYKMADCVTKKDERFFYMIDTHGGQSGSPLLKDNTTSIGIHNYGGCENSGSDLYKGFLDFVNNW